MAFVKGSRVVEFQTVDFFSVWGLLSGIRSDLVVGVVPPDHTAGETLGFCSWSLSDARAQPFAFCRDLRQSSESDKLRGGVGYVRQSTATGGNQ